jgi:hypothetical protein
MWTMIDGFEVLEAHEFDTLLDAPALITILVGAADGELDREERIWSERLLRARTYNRPKQLNEFYRVVVEGFWVKVNGFLAELPMDTEARGQEISRRLEQLNTIFPKIDVQLAADLYKGFRGLARETAEASGGFLRLGAISIQEKQWIDLPMLNPILAPKSSVEDPEDNWEEEDNI